VKAEEDFTPGVPLLPSERLVFSTHALKAMFARGISEADVQYVLATGKTLEAYLDDQPYPSRLILGWAEMWWPLTTGLSLKR
jgi:hypothetical protein